MIIIIFIFIHFIIKNPRLSYRPDAIMILDPVMEEENDALCLLTAQFSLVQLTDHILGKQKTGKKIYN